MYKKDRNVKDNEEESVEENVKENEENIEKE